MKHTLLPSLLALSFAACGGSSRNKPLAKQVDSVHLAPVSAHARGAEADAERSVFIAEWQLEFTKAEIEEADLTLNIAKNELASAKIGLKTADLKSDAAAESEEQNRMQRSEGGLSEATLQVEVKEHAIEKAKQNIAFLKRRLIHEEKVHRSHQANLEYIKSELLGKAAINPPKFNRAAYKSQLASRKSEVKSDLSGLGAARAKLDAATKAWTAVKAKSGAMHSNTSAPLETTPSPKPIPPPPEIKPPTSEKTPPPPKLTPEVKPVPSDTAEPADTTASPDKSENTPGTESSEPVKPADKAPDAKSEGATP